MKSPIQKITPKVKKYQFSESSKGKLGHIDEEEEEQDNQMVVENFSGFKTT